MAADVGDLDGDGDPNIVVASSNFAQNVVAFVNQGNGDLAAGISTPIGNIVSNLVLADFDGDGSLDFALSNWNSDTLPIHPVVPRNLIATGNQSTTWARQDGLRLEGALTTATLLDNTYLAGSKGSYGSFSVDGQPLLVESGASLTHLPGAARELDSSSPARELGNLALTFEANPVTSGWRCCRLRVASTCSSPSRAPS